MGYHKYDGRYCFQHFHSIGLDSTYAGQFKIEPQGSYEKWEKLVIDITPGVIPLQLALCIGFSANLIGFIGSELSLDTLIVHLYNDSSKGKTTTLMLILSPFGCPDQQIFKYH